MKLTEILNEQSIAINLASTDKEGIIRELTQFMAKAGKVSSADVTELAKAVMDREAHGSTAIAEGIAIPHARHACVSQVVAVMGKAPQGVQFGSLDGKPTRLFLLMVSPNDSGRKHVQVLAHISRLLIKEQMRKDIIAAETPAAIIEIIRKEEDKF